MQADPSPQHSAQSTVEQVTPAELLARAEGLEAEGRVDEAQAIYGELVRDHADHPAVLFKRAFVAIQRGRLDKAEELLRQAIGSAPGNAELHNALGVVLQDLERLDEAETALRKALDLMPTYADAQYNLAVLLEARGDVDQALEAYQQTLKLDLAHAKALTRIGVIYQQKASLKTALQYLDRAIAADPRAFQAHYYRGWVLSDLRRHDEALESLGRARGLRPDSLEAEQATANALRHAGRLDQALDAYWALLEKVPGNVSLHSDFNQIAWVAGRKDHFLRSFELARKQLGDEPELIYLEAAFRMRSEDYPGAEGLLRKGLEIAPERAELTGLLARALAAQGKLEQSYVLFTAAAQAQPYEMVHWQEFGFTLLRGGRADQAQRVFEQALGFSPFDQTVLSGLTLAYREMGDSRYDDLVDFSRYVRSYDLPPPEGFRDVADFNRALAGELDALHHATQAPIDQTLRGGTQTPGQLFAERLPCVQHLYEAISTTVTDYIRRLPVDPRHPVAARRAESFRVVGSWSCRLQTGGYHNNHVHPQGWLSSAYYARLPEDFDYTEERLGWLKFGESNLALGGRDRPGYLVRPTVGRLVLFPSFYWHGTVPFHNRGDRLTVAFDIAPEGASATRAGGVANA